MSHRKSLDLFSALFNKQRQQSHRAQMPLIDPVTMASTVTKRGASSSSPASSPTNDGKETTYSLLPVQTNPTPLSQTLRHAHPLLLGAVLALRFPALVFDPVSAMSGSILPLTAALQVAYAVICLPIAGATGASQDKKVKTRSLKPSAARKTPSEGGNNAIVVCVLFTVLSFFFYKKNNNNFLHWLSK